MGLLENPLAKQGIEELVQLGVYLRCYGIESLFSFDLSMARGLDYYTGVILEAVLVGSSTHRFLRLLSFVPRRFRFFT